MILDKLENASIYYGISENISTALKFLQKTDLTDFENGKYEVKNDDIFVIVQDYKTKPQSDGKFEAHKKFIDIQYIISGEEKIGCTSIFNLIPTTECDDEKDIVFFEGDGDFLTLNTGDFAIFFPNDGHMPGIITKSSNNVKKAVIKIKVK